MPETPEIPEELVLADEATAGDEAAVASAPEGVAPGAVRVPEAAKEHDPMLDIHVPQATHTWKDFFIHVGTICVGLLIAVGLEQTVEAIHHHHQRVELESDLRAETQKNARLYSLDDVYFAQNAARLAVLRHYVDALRRKEPAESLLKITVPPDPDSYIFWNPTDSSWQTAKQSSLLALLPRDEASMYNDVYFQNELMIESSKPYFQAAAAQRRFESRFQNPIAPAPHGADKLPPMGPNELDQYSSLIADSIDSLDGLRRAADLGNSVALAVLQGAHSADQVEESVAKAHHFTNAPNTPNKSPAK
jgi:hypothetical protein